MEDEDRTAFAINLLCRLMRMELNQMVVNENTFIKIKNSIKNSLEKHTEGSKERNE